LNYVNSVEASKELRMRTLSPVTILCALALAAMIAVAQDKKPINAKCPVKGEAAKADITSDYQGKTIGFC
jgi:hypothetical protein